MKNIVFNYYELDKKCYLNFDNLNTIDEIKTDAIIINVQTKEVEDIHRFFQKTMAKAIIDDVYEELNIDDSNIKALDFYVEDSFEKLLLFLNQQIQLYNSTIEKIKKSHE